MENPSFTIRNPLIRCIVSFWIFQKMYWKQQVSGCLLIAPRGSGFHCLMTGDQLHYVNAVNNRLNKNIFVFLAP